MFWYFDQVKKKVVNTQLIHSGSGNEKYKFHGATDRDGRRPIRYSYMYSGPMRETGREIEKPMKRRKRISKPMKRKC